MVNCPLSFLSRKSFKRSSSRQMSSIQLPTLTEGLYVRALIFISLVAMTTLKMDAKKRNSLKTVASKKPPKPYQTVRKSEKATDTSIKQSSTHPKLQTNTPVGLPRSLTGQTGGETVRRSSSLVDISKTENNELINGTNTKCSSDSALVCSLQRDVEVRK